MTAFVESTRSRKIHKHKLDKNQFGFTEEDIERDFREYTDEFTKPKGN